VVSVNIYAALMTYSKKKEAKKEKKDLFCLLIASLNTFRENTKIIETLALIFSHQNGNYGC